jgi:hypothetical protein
MLFNMADISQADGTFRGGPQPPFLAGFQGGGEVIVLGEGGADSDAWRSCHWSRTWRLFDPRTFGELRKHYHKSLSAILVGEIEKDLTGHNIQDIEKALRTH